MNKAFRREIGELWNDQKVCLTGFLMVKTLLQCAPSLLALTERHLSSTRMPLTVTFGPLKRLQCTLTWSCFPFLSKAELRRLLLGSALCGSSLHCRSFGLEAEERPIRPITEKLEVLQKLMAGLQDVKVRGEVRRQGRRSRIQLWCFDSLHLWRERWKNVLN